MKSRAVLAAIVFGLAASLAFAQTPQQEQKPGQPTPQTPAQKQTMQKGGQADMQKVRDEYVAAWSKADARAVAMLHAEQAVVVNGMGEVMAGRQAVQQSMEKQFAGPWKGTTLTVTPGRQHSVGNDVIVEEGRFRISGGQAGGAEAQKMGGQEEGHYLVTLGRVEGQWRIVSHASFTPQRGPGTQKPMP
jgi:uncharacterized protein (TIGR02246 family)